MGEGSQLCRSFCPRDSKGQGARMVRPRSKWKGLQFFLKRNWRGRPTWGHSQSLHLLTFKNEAPFTEEMSSLLHLSRRDMCRWNTKCFLLILHLILVTGGNNALSWEKKVPILTQNMLGEVYKERLSTPEHLICKILLRLQRKHFLSVPHFSELLQGSRFASKPNTVHLYCFLKGMFWQVVFFIKSNHRRYSLPIIASGNSPHVSAKNNTRFPHPEFGALTDSPEPSQC